MYQRIPEGSRYVKVQATQNVPVEQGRPPPLAPAPMLGRGEGLGPGRMPASLSSALQLRRRSR